MTTFVHRSAMRTAWYMVAESADVDADPVPVQLLGDRIVLWRGPDGVVIAAPDRCPHREAPLSTGAVAEGVLTCPYHGWRFATSGRCIEVPSSGPDAAIAPAAHLGCLHVQERYGLVWVCPGQPATDIPTVSHDDNPAFRRINSGIQHWSVSAPRMVDNFMDISHFPWVHTGTFGGAQSPVVPHIDMEPLDDGWFGYSYEVEARNPASAAATTGSDEAVVHRKMSTGFHLPTSTRSTIAYADGLEHILLLCNTPIDDTNTLFTFVVWRNDDFSVDAEEIISFDRAIGAEDKVMLETMRGTLPLTQTGLTSVQSDRASVEWKRQFVAFLDAADDAATPLEVSS